MSPELLPNANRSIELASRKAFEKVFANIVAMPSYLQIAQSRADEDMPDASVTDWYHKSVELARDAIYAVPETDEHHESADGDLLTDIFSNTDGTEVRMVMTGFKPAAVISSKVKSTIGEVPQELIDIRSLLAHGLPNPDLAFTHGLKYLAGDMPKYGSGFLYSKSAISELVAHNSELLTKLGYDVTQSAEDIFEEVVHSTDKFTQSLFLGYPPYTSLLFQAMHPDDLIIFDHTARDNPERIAAVTERFWEVAQIMTTPEQLTLLQRLASDPKQFKDLDLLGTSTGDYIRHSPNNKVARNVLESIGMTEYVTFWRQALGSSHPRDEIQF